MNDKQERAFRETLNSFINSLECIRVSKDGIASGSWVQAKLEKLKECIKCLPDTEEYIPGKIQPEVPWEQPILNSKKEQVGGIFNTAFGPHTNKEEQTCSPKIVASKHPSFNIDTMIDAFMADKPKDWNGRFFFLMIARMVETFIKKNTDYAGLDGQKFDMLANFRESENIGVPMLKGILVRSGDKWMRIKNLTREDRKGMVSDEAIVDTMLDLANYMLIAIVAHMSTFE